MMATVLRKVKLGNKNKSETLIVNDEIDNGNGNQGPRMNSTREKSFSDKKRRRDATKVCSGPADSVGNHRRRNRPQERRNYQSHLTLFRSLQLRIDLWTTTTGHLLDRSFARRFCHRKSENELYRSNSFRFEKFDKQEDLPQQVSLCDDYSLPVDFVNRRKFETGSFERRETKQRVDVVENYFDPKDTRVLQRSKKSDRNRSQVQQQFKRHSNPVDTSFLGKELRTGLRASVLDESSTTFQPLERRPSPYYYSDLLNQDDLEPSAFKSYRKSEAKPSEPVYSQSSKQVNRFERELESYHPFSAKENFEPKQGGLDFYDFASGKVRKKHRVVEVKGNLSKKRVSRERREEEEEDKERAKAEGDSIGIGDDEYEERKIETNESEYLKTSAFDVSPGHRNKYSLKQECKKSASLDIPPGENIKEEVGEHSNKFRPIVPVKETEEGIEGGDEGDEEEEEVKRDKKKSLKKLSQYNYNYKDCLTGVPLKTFPSENDFSPAEILQHVIHSGSDSKSLLAACLAEWDAHARLMRPLTARALTQCACAIGAQKDCESSDEDDGDYHYSRTPIQLNSNGKKGPSQDTIRRRDFFKEPIPDGENLGDEFVKGKKVKSSVDDCENVSIVNEGSLKSEKSVNAREIFCNWGIIVNEKGGFESWNEAYDENSDSAEAYRIAREIIEETENWDSSKGSFLKQGCRSTDSLDDLDNMNRRGLLYETAFDCKVSKSDDDLEELDRVTNHPVLHSKIGRSKSAVTAPLIESYSRPPRPGSSFSRNSFLSSVKNKPVNKPKTPADNTGSELSEITEGVQNMILVQTPTPPSTAPLPSKFCGHEDFEMTSIKSAPELSTSPSPMRIKDNRLPVKSLRARDSRPSSLLTSSTEPLNSEKKYSEVSKGSLCQDNENINNNNNNNSRNENVGITKPRSLVQNPGLILEFKGRPDLTKKSRVSRPKSLIGDMRPVLGQRKSGRLKFSSTESMTTSSSGGSLESIKSSTSEGNRSTSSSDSHRSSTLSSHSSDSTGNVVAITTANLQFHLKQTNPHHAQSNKLQNALSPISDKSSVDPGSETSENNKNNNSQKASPEDNVQQAFTPTNASLGQQQQPIGHVTKTDMKSKRRGLQNKNLINLSLQNSCSSNEAQGSDSGISVESRTARSSGISSNQTETDFSDLPFDMPKLRRRRQAEQENGSNRRLLEADACTSSSATSVDFRDLPFDMPKLRRRLRPATLSESQASSCQSVSEQTGNVLFRPSMTLSLDLESGGIQKRGLSLDLERGRGCGTMTLGAFSGVDLIDPSLPLEKQAWYHGAITRVEAETLLRSLREGSYLVRNSESTRQDYSLSLKSAKGFMHMRIQMDNGGKFVLGQFSKPFETIPDMIRHYSINRLPIRGAEHMCLLKPVAARLL